MALTKEDKIRMFAMRLDGASYSDIAREYDISREYVRQIFEGILDTVSTRSLRYNKSCIYPGIKNWLDQNDTSAFQLAQAMGMNYPTNLYDILTGKHMPRKEMIDRLLIATGLTYEQAFGPIS